MSPEKALHRLKGDLDELGLQLKLYECGRKVRTAKCDLFDSSGACIESGLGKGVGLQGKLSAGFEALEHVLSTNYSDLYSDAVRVPIQDLSSTLNCWNNPQIKNFPSKLSQDAEVFCVTFRHILNEARAALVPQALIDVRRPGCEYSNDSLQKLVPLGTNNGTAVGASFEEAFLHALCELIERDSFAQCLLAAFVKKKPNPIHLIDRHTFPGNISNLVEEAEAEAGCRIVVWDMTSEIGIPVFGAIVDTCDRAVPPLGCGASIQPAYAVERAVTEALQDFHIWNGKKERENRHRLANLDVWPALRAAAACRINELPSGCALHVGFPDDSDSAALSVYDQLNDVLQRLKLCGSTVLYGIHKELKSGTICLRIIIPELEMFHLVRAGMLVLPGERGGLALQR